MNSNYYYSAINNAFYSAELILSYVEADNWPDDAISVTDDCFIEFSEEPPVGMYRQPDAEGMPSWVNIPPPTQEDLISNANDEKAFKINETNNYINSKQWPGKAAMGRLTDAEKEQYNLWLDYLDALEAVDTSSAPDINWPLSPEV
ncbi:TPA: tail fiber assembly protein [Escherichia coli]|nr:tail fiber assembly protein [Escherichia coli]